MIGRHISRKRKKPRFSCENLGLLKVHWTAQVFNPEQQLQSSECVCNSINGAHDGVCRAFWLMPLLNTTLYSETVHLHESLWFYCKGLTRMT